ncbi:MAG TPA: hypothetical protein VK563_09590 [Puia sp.]|nr:hypothetical protein [Puia sp.]
MTDPSSNLSGDRVFNQFSPKRLILQVRSICMYILSRWKPVFLVGLILGLAGATYSYFKKPDYVAQMTFALDEGAASAAQSPRNGLSEFTEALGIGQTYDAGGVFSTPTNIVELMTSRLLIEKALRGKVAIDDHVITFADFFLDSLEYRRKWLEDKRYAGLSYPIVNGDRKDSLFQNGLFRSMYEILLAKNIRIDKMGKGTTIFEATCTSHHELFSKLFLEALMNEVVRYYVDVKTERAKLNLEFIQKRTDSIQQAYNKSLYGKASYNDEHINPILQIAQVAKDKQQTDIQILKSTYIDLNRSLESAKTTLIRETPLIQYVDTPILPLKMLRSNMIKFFLIGFFAGFLLMAGYFGLKKGWSYLE